MPAPIVEEAMREITGVEPTARIMRNLHGVVMLKAYQIVGASIRA